MMTLSRRCASALCALSLTLAACGGSDDATGSDSSSGEGGSVIDDSNDASGTESSADDVDAGEAQDPLDDAGELDLDDEATSDALDNYADQLGLDGADPDSIFAGYRFWSGGVRFRETLPGGRDDLGDRSLENNTGVLAEQSMSPGTGGKGFLRGVVSTDYDSAWLRNGTDELVRARFDSTELETILIEDLVPSGGLRAIGGDSEALYLVVNSDTGTKANFIIELDPATGDERRRIDLSVVSTNLNAIDVNATHIVVGRAIDEVVVIDRATLSEAYTLQVTEGKNFAVPLLTTDEIYVISPGRGDQVDLLTRFSLSDGSLLEADRALQYAGVNRAFGDIVVHWNSDLPDMPVYGLSPDAEQLIAALPDDLNKIYDIHIGEQFIVVGGEGPQDPDDNQLRGVFFVDRATNTVVWDMLNWMSSPDMDIVAPPG